MTNRHFEVIFTYYKHNQMNNEMILFFGLNNIKVKYN